MQEHLVIIEQAYYRSQYIFLNFFNGYLETISKPLKGYYFFAER